MKLKLAEKRSTEGDPKGESSIAINGYLLCKVERDLLTSDP